MGKAARWLRSLLGGKKAPVTPEVKPAAKEKKRWGFVRSSKEKDRKAQREVISGEERKGSYREESCSSSYVSDGVDPNKHAIAVAAATAAVAEAAVAAAEAAAEVVRLTSSRRCTTPGYLSGSSANREDLAAVAIQAAFRGYLARRALKALKGLVKLQALVRGHIVRKQAAETLRCMQALVRVQARARRGRVSEHRQTAKSSQSHPGPATPEKYEPSIRSSSYRHDRSPMLKWNASKSQTFHAVDMDKVQASFHWLDRWMDEKPWDSHEIPRKGGTIDDENTKILEVDPGKPHLSSKRRSTNLQPSHSTLNSHSFATLPDSPSKDSTTAHASVPSPSSVEMQFALEAEDSAFCTANNSPQFYSASSRTGSARSRFFTPSKSECSRSLFSGYSDYPNYMANTQSSRAKVRSQSAPKQRPELEKSSSKRFSGHAFGDSRASTCNGQASQNSSALHARFTSKAYPGSGRLDRLGMPIREVVGYTSTNGTRY